MRFRLGAQQQGSPRSRASTGRCKAGEDAAGVTKCDDERDGVVAGDGSDAMGTQALVTSQRPLGAGCGPQKYDLSDGHVRAALEVRLFDQCAYRFDVPFPNRTSRAT